MRLLACLLFSLFIHQLSFAQQDIDTAFKQVRTKAEAKNYNEALKILNTFEQKYPGNEDIIVYQGRVYSWKRDFSKAKKTLRPLVDREKPNMEALEALINAYYWSYDFEACITYCDQYLALQPDNADILIIKATCLEKTGRDTEALALIDQLPEPYKSNEKATGLKTIISRKKKNAIAASYLNISTADPGESPTHYGYVEYLRKFTKSTIVGRANIGYRYGETEGQVEADFYQTFKRSYLYANAGFSNGEFIFPQLRLGTEYYFAPQAQFDFSLGARYMHFEDDNVTLLTGQAGYRFGEYTVAYRPYYDVNNTLFSHVVSFQKYDEQKENLVRLELQYGNVPYLYIYSNSIEPLTAYRAGIQYQHRFGDSFFIKPVFLYEYEEYLPDSFRHKFNCQIIFTKRF
ncbi:YaiO family outer membrane beta-barrel protein [Flavobacterium hauense]